KQYIKQTEYQTILKQYIKQTEYQTILMKQVTKYQYRLHPQNQTKVSNKQNKTKNKNTKQNIPVPSCRYQKRDSSSCSSPCTSTPSRKPVLLNCSSCEWCHRWFLFPGGRRCVRIHGSRS